MQESFPELTIEIFRIIEKWETKLIALPDNQITENRNSQNRNIKQILGHLIDSASNNHQRIVRLQYTHILNFPDYQKQNDKWIAIQDYENENWENLVSFWKYYNLHMIHIIRNVSDKMLDHTWTDGEGNHVTLREIIKGYLEHLKLHMKEIQELIK